MFPVPSACTAGVCHSCFTPGPDCQRAPQLALCLADDMVLHHHPHTRTIFQHHSSQAQSPSQDHPIFCTPQIQTHLFTLAQGPVSHPELFYTKVKIFTHHWEVVNEWLCGVALEGWPTKLFFLRKSQKNNLAVCLK